MKFVVALMVLACLAGLVYAMVEGLRMVRRPVRGKMNSRHRRYAGETHDSSFWYPGTDSSHGAHAHHHDVATHCAPADAGGSFDAGGSCDTGGGDSGGGGGDSSN